VSKKATQEPGWEKIKSSGGRGATQQPLLRKNTIHRNKGSQARAKKDRNPKEEGLLQIVYILKGEAFL